MKREYKVLTALVVSSLMGFSAMTAEAAVTVTGPITETEITGNSDTGTASGNTLNVTDASSDSTGIRIYGGTVSGGESGDASNNTVNVTNTQVSQAEIYGGQSRLGATNNNTVIFDSSSTAAAVYGAYGNTASGNHVESAGTSNFLYGGRSYTNNSGNSVLVTGGSVQYTLSGSQADNGSAADNTVEIRDGTFGVVYGAQGKGVENNSVTMSGGTVSQMISGGYNNQPEGSAVNNKVVMTGGAVISSGDTESVVPVVSGGWAIYGTADQNSVEISKAVSIAGSVAGGWSYLGDVTNNVVKISSGSVGGIVAGGYTIGKGAEGNTVELSGTADVSGNIYGGYALHQMDNPLTGEAAAGDASQNTVKISDVTVKGEVYGGYTAEGTTSNDATGNAVTIESGTIEKTVYGGYTADGTASKNTVTINGGTVGVADSTESSDTVFGGYSASGEAVSNILTVSGGDLIGHVTSGYGKTGASDNTLTMTGGSSTKTVAGYAETGDAVNNTLVFSGGTSAITMAAQSGGSATGNTITITGGNPGTVTGGAGVTGASENTVIISGGTLDTDIYGGQTYDGAADNNTINILAGDLNPEMSLYGGYGTTESKNNTYNMYTKGQTVADFAYFQNLNFYVPEGTTAGETMLTVTGNAAVDADTTLAAVQNSTTTDGTTDVSGATVFGGVQRNTKLNPGEYINLLYNANGITTDDTSYGTIDGLDTVTSAGFINYKAIVEKKDANTIVITIPKDEKGTSDTDTKILPEDRENAANTIKNAGDIIAGSALHAAEGAWIENHDIEAKFVPYAIVGGYDLHYNTGSYIDSNGMAANVGFVRRSQHEGHIDTIMPFFEYGKSHYASYLDTGARGDGRQHYTGGGILLRRDFDSGLYYEGAVRAGYLKGDFHGMIAKSMSRYDSGAPYIAAQAGLGKIYTRNRDSYDIYGKFFYTYLGSNSAVVHSGYGDSKYDFDSINSYVTRLGMRWTRDFDQIRSLYAGIGWDYEAGSKARPPTQAGIPQARPSKAPAASSNSAGRARSTIPTHGASTSRPPAGPASRKAVPSLRPSAITFK
ncbi:beta strand repeat-containing protein [Dialister hominis]|uniref:beta strand repeat-containing protein n=1 Tax=Dialister hominis TaxID=2582419 RepID=UPI003AAE8623